jgi:peptide/nickel transport system permease protein
MTQSITAPIASRSRFAHTRSQWRRPTIIAALIVAAFWLIVVVTVQWWAPYAPLDDVGGRLRPPSRAHWLGTDALSRDVFTRTLYGARETLSISVAVIVTAVSIGSAVGAIAGFLGGWVDSVIMRCVDVTMAFPPIFLAMAVAAALGSGLRNAFFAMVIVWWPIYARLLRGQVLAVKHRDHIQAAVSIGATRSRILRKHVLPLSFTPALINATLDLGQVVILTATLSFLGLGAKPPSPEWGAMITDGAQFFYQWWVAVAPGLAILTVAMAFNFLGDGLRDALDVRAKR